MWFDRLVCLILGATFALVIAVWASIGWLIPVLAVGYLTVILIGVSRSKHRRKQAAQQSGGQH